MLKYIEEVSLHRRKEGKHFKGEMNGSKVKMLWRDRERMLRVSASCLPLHLSPDFEAAPGATVTLASKLHLYK